MKPLLILKSELPVESRSVLIDESGLQFGLFRTHLGLIKAWKWEVTRTVFILQLYKTI